MPTLKSESEHEQALPLVDLLETWRMLTPDERLDAFFQLEREDAENLFLQLLARDQHQLLASMPEVQHRSWLRLLPPDDAADLIQEGSDKARAEMLALLDEATRREVVALLAYAEDEAGGLMSPRYARVRPESTVDEAISYLRKQARMVLENINYVYVIDADQKLVGVISLRDVFAASADKTVRELMATDLVTVKEQTDQEDVARMFAKSDLQAIPVVDDQGRMKGIVTVDDIVDVLQEEATEDIQKIGGTQALDAPYLQVGILGMVKKRVGWLAILFLGEMLTTHAMGRFEHAIEQAVVLALFVPLIISSGGNSGSQATTLVIRAMALGEVKLGDWWRVIHREMWSGLLMGLILGVLAFGRIEFGQRFFDSYGPHHLLVAWTISGSVLGVVTWGTLAGSTLPFVLRRVGLDPASASAPFVATLVDVTGIVIYFTLATLLLRGTLL